METQEKTFTLSKNHYSIATWRERITRKQLQSLLLNYNDTIIFHGNVVKLKFKHIGAGIYEVYKDLPENKE